MKIFYDTALQKWLAFVAPEKPEFKGDYFLHYGPWKAYEKAYAEAKANALEVGNENMAVYQDEDGWFCDCSPKGSNKVPIRWESENTFSWPDMAFVGDFIHDILQTAFTMKIEELFKNFSPLHAYAMGVDNAINGANEINCHFRIFSTPENTAAWERGKRDGEKKKLESIKH